MLLSAFGSLLPITILTFFSGGGRAEIKAIIERRGENSQIITVVLSRFHVDGTNKFLFYIDLKSMKYLTLPVCIRA
jgi:hypothetical protein